MSARFLKSPILDGLPFVQHGFFTRQGGVSQGIYASLNCGPGSADAPDAVADNRRRVRAALGHPDAPLLTLHQVHGKTVQIIARPPEHGLEHGIEPGIEPWPDTAPRPKADGLATRLPGIVLGILTADCVPVLFAEPQARVIGACHAGWRGALSGIVEATVAAMIGLGAERQRIRAAIGPAIRQASYEVGPEFPAPFLAADPENHRFFKENPKFGRLHFDLPAYVGRRLAAAGLGEIDDLGNDTLSVAETFFSYRRGRLKGEPDYGRQISAIVLAPAP